MSQNFNNGKIYKITNNINNEVYVGSTCDILRKRFNIHKLQITQESKKNRPLYKLMNELGTHIFRIDLIEDYPCDDKQALRQREGYWIRQLGTLNQQIAGRTEKQKYIDNKEIILERNKKYVEEHKERRQEYMTEYSKEYNKKPEIIEKKKEYYKQKNNCEYGSICRRDAIALHRKTKKHLDFLENNKPN